MNSISTPLYLITGASRGIGKHLLNHFASAGNEVIGVYHSTEPDSHAEHCYRVDLTDEASTAAFVESIKSRLKNVVLLNVAGITYNALAHKADMNIWKQVIDTNLVACFNLARLLLPIMRQDNYGRIINFSSVVAQSGVMGTSAYAASKSALWGLGKALAVENAFKNVTINAINLGYFNIGIIEKVPDKMLPDIIVKIPAQRLGHPDEITSTVEYIIKTAYLNGASIDLNGGLF